MFKSCPTFFPEDRQKRQDEVCLIELIKPAIKYMN